MARPPTPVEVFGIRHHGPGSARSLVAALEEYQPDAVLIEGPADADPLLHWASADSMIPPVALLAYAPEQPKVGGVLAVRGVLAGVAGDGLGPAAPESRSRFCRPARGHGAGPASRDDDLRRPIAGAGGEPTSEPRRADPCNDPLGALAAAAGYDDPERWWDDLVESRLDGSSPFPMLIEAMAELRRLARRGSGPREHRREAYMRQTIRAALKRGRARIAVVCGAWHAPELTWPLPPAIRGRGHPARVCPGARSPLTWVPWTHERLASASGYGAGVDLPGLVPPPVDRPRTDRSPAG